MITVEINRNTTMLRADREARREIISFIRSGEQHRIEGFIAEELHEQWEFVAPQEVGALTDAPILAQADAIVRDDDGHLTEIGMLCWFPDYAITDPWLTLALKGCVTFALSPEDCVDK